MKEAPLQREKGATGNDAWVAEPGSRRVEDQSGVRAEPVDMAGLVSAIENRLERVLDVPAGDGFLADVEREIQAESDRDGERTSAPPQMRIGSDDLVEPPQQDAGARSATRSSSRSSTDVDTALVQARQRLDERRVAATSPSPARVRPFARRETRQTLYRILTWTAIAVASAIASVLIL